MVLKVTAAQAGYLVDRHERIVRWHIGRGDLAAAKKGNAWAIDVDDLERVPGWQVNRDRLAELQVQDARTAEGLAATVARLASEVAALRSRVRMLESSQNAPVTRSEAILTEQTASTTHHIAPMPPERPATVYVATGAGSFRTRADAGRWLAQHGINESTVKTWPGWRDVELEPRTVLLLALSLYDPGNWRITWRLHRCADPACVCRELLAAE